MCPSYPHSYTSLTLATDPSTSWRTGRFPVGILASRRIGSVSWGSIASGGRHTTVIVGLYRIAPKFTDSHPLSFLAIFREWGDGPSLSTRVVGAVTTLFRALLINTAEIDL